MNIQENISLQPYNTFGIDVQARYFVEINQVEDLVILADHELFRNNEHLILGGGSNILLTKDFEGLVIKNKLKGIKVIKEDDDHVWVRFESGENWHECVTFCVENGYGGVENLALIPGSVGAAPIQNIGAYGVELKDVFESMTVYNWVFHEFQSFDLAACDFGYRNSVFKKKLKGKVFVESVTLRLEKNRVLDTSYGAIENRLTSKKIEDPTIRDVYEAVIEIRSSKLPDPKVIGNAGSFFKNPELPKKLAQSIMDQFENVPHYIIDDKTIKIPAGWLIEKCGWKGYVDGEIGVHDKQALVLVNRGNGNGDQIKQLAYKILDSVEKRFGVRLSPEVNII